MTNSNLDDVISLAREESFLATISTIRSDGAIQSTLVNAGVMADPASGEQVVATVLIGSTAKLRILRTRPNLTLSWRSGWRWITVEGTARIIGPDDPAPAVDSERLRLLLREVFVAAGGQHEDWDEYDETMRTQRRAAVLVTPTRIYSNPNR
ncbi:MAG TPA: TIGR03618 family F420-dependent PPOX class oxidoreductase [Pseudonocardia sp.]|jgi:PPOX class probable F420-dependent enzyme|nr:TIGR03618 family F420-dependent PPOX class oxidoreductase [Pseudonocardia sp.]